MASNSSVQAIIATLAYYDMFDYPLTREEVKKYLPTVFSQKEFEIGLKSKKIQQKRNFFFLAGRGNIVTTRLERKGISEQKLQKAQRVLLFLQYIPTILYIGISGSLAMKNAKETDDIDLFIITRPYTLWMSRLLVNGMLLFSGNLRRFRRQHTQNTICTNMWMDVCHLAFSGKRQNIYTAHEILQLVSIVNKDNTYERFLSDNMWIQAFFPNTQVNTTITRFPYPGSLVFWPLELVARMLQLFYMQRHRTTETITTGFVAFHPKDYTNQVLQKWKGQQKKWNIE